MKPDEKETYKLTKDTPSIEQIAVKKKVSLSTLKAQLNKGKKVEHEHTSDNKTAEKIARDHLDEIPDYYDRLDKMEKDAGIKEDAPAVSAGGGGVAGIGVGPKGEPGSPPRKLIRRTKFAGHEVFEVDNDAYHKARLGKAKYHRYERYVGNDEVGEEIRQYGRSNPGKPIILKHSVNGALQFLKYGKY